MQNRNQLQIDQLNCCLLQHPCFPDNKEGHKFQIEHIITSECLNIWFEQMLPSKYLKSFQELRSTTLGNSSKTVYKFIFGHPNSSIPWTEENFHEQFNILKHELIK